LLRGIRGLLYDDGMTIKGVQKILRERGLRHVIGLGTLPSELEEARVVEAVVAPAAEAPRQPAPSAVPQRDLFDAETAVAEVVEAVASTTETASEERPRPVDKSALRGLVAKLQALRKVMIEGSAR
jgi:hypothetical protein